MSSTILYENHKKLGAKFVEFSGWTMPVQYSNIKEEHFAVRNDCGLFDVSHMGECFIEGEGATAAVNNIITNDVSKIKPYKALYTVMCYDDGGVVDDLIVYKFNDQKYLLCLNAGNIQKDLDWIKNNLSSESTMKDISPETGLISLQGPKAESLLKSLKVSADEGPNLNEFKAFQFFKGKVEGIEVICARTGYTGEDGFEFFHSTKDSNKLWDLFLDKGKKFGIKPIGLGARDTLRLEAALPLYGHELNEERNPYQTNLSWVIKLDKPKFIGKSVLLKYKDNPGDTLIGLEVIEPGIAREGYKIFNGSGQEIGVVSSGCPSPSINKNIAMAFKKIGETAEYVDIRGHKKKVKEISMPFVTKKPKK